MKVLSNARNVNLTFHLTFSLGLTGPITKRCKKYYKFKFYLHHLSKLNNLYFAIREFFRRRKNTKCPFKTFYFTSPIRDVLMDFFA